MALTPEREGHKSLLLREATKYSMSLEEKKRLVSIGRQLQTLSQEDIDYIMSPGTNEFECQQRMIAARHKKE